MLGYEQFCRYKPVNANKQQSIKSMKQQQRYSTIYYLFTIIFLGTPFFVPPQIAQTTTRLPST